MNLIVIVGLVLIFTSFGVGYQFGTLSSSNPTPAPSEDKKESIPEPKEEAGKTEDEELEDIPDGDMGSISAGFLEPCKLVRLPDHS